MIGALKNFFKRHPRLYRASVYVFGGQPQFTTAHDFVKKFPHNALIVNVGSGPRNLGRNVTNIDIFPFENVDIIADATKLPFENESVDAVVCDNVLEHTPRPHDVVKEILRVLKKDGRVYIATPFVIPYHSSPGDYYRWSEEGLRELLKDFSEQELRVQYGPSAAFTMVLSEWLALLLSFNSQILFTVWYAFFTVVTAPLKLFDYLLVHYRGAKNLALDLYFIGLKK